MYLHYLLKNGNSLNETEEKDRGALFTLIKYFWPKSSERFFYNIGGYTFTLEEMKHSLLRYNKKPLNSFFRLMDKTDERTDLLDSIADPRILFI